MKRTFVVLGVALASGASIALANRPAAATLPAPQEHIVEMVLKDGAYRFQPAEVKARAGDRVTFVLASGAPHNVAFDAEQIPDAAEAALSRVLRDRMSPLAGPLLTTDGAKYTIQLDGVPAGRYPFFCMPHAALAMTGTLVVE